MKQYLENMEERKNNKIISTKRRDKKEITRRELEDYTEEKIENRKTAREILQRYISEVIREDGEHVYTTILREMNPAEAGLIMDAFNLKELNIKNLTKILIP